MTSIRFAAPGLTSDPGADGSQECLSFASVTFSGECVDIQAAHASVAHQLGHAIDDDNGIVAIFKSFESGDEARCVLAVHHMYDEDNVRRREILFDVEPFAIAERRAEVVGSDTQIEFV